MAEFGTVIAIAGAILVLIACVYGFAEKLVEGGRWDETLSGLLVSGIAFVVIGLVMIGMKYVLAWIGIL